MKSGKFNFSLPVLSALCASIAFEETTEIIRRIKKEETYDKPPWLTSTANKEQLVLKLMLFLFFIRRE